MNQKAMVDVVILGGGIAGLWLLNRLRKQGYSAILLEKQALGSGQTVKAQGILHGGMKYALTGSMTAAARQVAAAPDLWQACLNGQGEVDLRGVPVLSSSQYLWTTDTLASKLGGFVAGKVLAGVEILSRGAFPPFFQHPDFRGQVYCLPEQVIDVPGLLRELAKLHQDVIFHVRDMDLQWEGKGLSALTLHPDVMPAVELSAKKYVFAAGTGNEELLSGMPEHDIFQQRRPLHMVMAKLEPGFAEPLYAHCLGAGTTPRITVTTHRAADGGMIWYLGGGIAEEGVNRSSEEQTVFAQKELQALFPWLDFSNVTFSSFRVDRAEEASPSGKRPDSFSVRESENCLVITPTKMVLAPMLSESVLQKLEGENIKTGRADLRALNAWPAPAIARPMWDEVESWETVS